MQHLEFPIVSFLVVFLLLCSLPSHIRAQSISLISLIFWLAAANIIHGVNSIVWAGNVSIRLEVWCDITTSILVGFTVAVPLSVLCVSSQLERISSNRHATFTEADKRKRKIVEAILCFGVPLPFMALHYVFQGHRFDIVEDIGCSPTTYVSIPSIICILIPPVLISLTSMIYSLAAIHHFLRRRIEFVSMLRNSNSVMTPARYFRLLLFTLSDIFFNSAANLFVLYFNIQNGVQPYVNWNFVHFDFSRIRLFPFILIPPTTWKVFLFVWWVPPVGSLLFIVLFGFTQEAISDYTAVWTWFKRRIHVLAGWFHTQKHVLPTHIRITRSRQVIVDANSTPTVPQTKPWDAEETLDSFDMVESSSTHTSVDSMKFIPISHVVSPLPAHFSRNSRPFSSYTL